MPAKTCDREGWVMHCSSFSKVLAPGYRIGWAAPGRFRKAMARQKLIATLATCVPVSYTHLDVYKRQGHCCAMRR